MSKLEWREIEGFKGFYSVSNTGLIKSLERVVFQKDGKTKRIKERLLKTPIESRGYLKACLCKNGKTKHLRVHTIVCREFKGFKEKPYQVNHIDGNKLNNNISNLEWCTPRENIQHAIKNGLWKKNV